MKKVSVIVPIYNVEQYLHKCINSILSQTFKDFELILVDDGSPDDCGNICDYYRQIDDRVIVIHKENGGLSSARNAGLSVATGKYISFVDSDDMIDKEMLNILYRLCEDYNASISSCVIHAIDKDKNISFSQDIMLFNNKEAIELTYDEKLPAGFSVCNKLFRRNLFENINFPVGRIYEDASILYKLYMKANKVVFIDKPLYYYIYRSNSITNSSNWDKRFDIVDLFNEKYEFMNENFPEMCDKVQALYYDNLRKIIVDIVNSGKEKENYRYIRKTSKLIRNQLFIILKNPCVRIIHKFLALIIAYTPRLAIMYYRQNI